MLSGIRLSFVAYSALLSVILIGTACGGPGANGGPSDSPTSPASTETDGGGGGDLSGVPPLWFAESLRTMVERYQTIVVGRVDGVREVRNLDAVNPTSRLENTPPRFPETVFDVKVLEVIYASRVAAGETIGFYQLGAVVDGKSVSVPDVNPFVKVGTTYLFFLEDLQPIFGLDEFTTPAFGRFVVGSNRLIIPNGWEASAGIAAVSGVPFSDMRPIFYADDQESARAALARRTVDEAAAAILAEIARAPLPPLPTREPVESPNSETVTPAPVEGTAIPAPASAEPAAEATSAPTPTSAP